MGRKKAWEAGECLSDEGRKSKNTRHQRPPHKDMTGSARALSPNQAQRQVSFRVSWDE